MPSTTILIVIFFVLVALLVVSIVRRRFLREKALREIRELLLTLFPSRRPESQEVPHSEVSVSDTTPAPMEPLEETQVSQELCVCNDNRAFYCYKCKKSVGVWNSYGNLL
jgi:hypothetical protein